VAEERGGEGLRPVAVVDAVTGAPLMLAYADGEALRLTAETGVAHFYSRSRRSLWLKGAGSGSLLRVLQVLVDCDDDAAAYVAYTERHVCHLGRSSCFHRVAADRRLEMLAELLEETRPHTRLVEGGRVLHPLTTWSPPPSPLLASLSAWLLAEHARRHGRPGAVVASGGGAALLGLLVAQRLRARLHAADCGPGGCVAPESLGEEDEAVALARWPGELAALVAAAEKRGARVSWAAAIASPGGWSGTSLLEARPGEPWPRLAVRLGAGGGGEG